MRFAIGPKNSTFDFGFVVAYICGYHPRYRCKRFRPIYLYNFVGSIILISFAMWESIATRNNIADFVQNFESASVFIMVFSKFVVQSSLDKNFVYFLDKTAYFWPVANFPAEIQAPVRRVLRQALVLQKTYFRFGIVTATLVVMSPFALKGIDLPFGTFTAEGHERLHYFIQFLQSTLIPLWAVYAMSTDCMFVGVSANLIAQFKMLNYLIQRLDFSEEPEKMMEKIKKCVVHHNYLTEYCRKLQDTYSPVMLMQCLTSITIFSSEMYMVRYSGFNLPVITRCLCMYGVILFEASMYCVLATLVEVEALEVMSAIYDCNWYKNYQPLPSKSLITVMSRCQKLVTFSAAGMMDVNLETLVKVMKVSYSICTLLTVMNRKGKLNN